MSELAYLDYFYEDIALFTPIFSLLNILSLVFLMLYMNYTAKYKNHDLSVAWYILGFFFPLPVAIAFAIKSKKFRHENTKVCSQCGDKYPATFSMCSRCLIDLPELDDPKRMKKKKLGKVFCVGFWLAMVASIVAMVVLFVTVFTQTLELFEGEDYNYRIGIETEAGETVYYDREGNTYSDPTAVLIYGEDGEIYTYTVVADEFGFESGYYVDEKGQEYDIYNSYVDEEGFFYFDENYEIYWDDSDYDYEAEEYEEFDFESYRYYQDRYYDEDGNLYYYADEVSWNEKGEIITAENDPNPVEETAE